MTLSEQRQRAVTIESGIRSVQKELSSALAAMDYEQALACQIKIDALRREVRRVKTGYSTTAKSKKRRLNAKPDCGRSAPSAPPPR